MEVPLGVPPSQATVPPAVKQEPGSSAPARSAPAVDERAAQRAADYIGSCTGTVRLFDVPAGAPAKPPGRRWKALWMPLLTAVTALALVAILLEELAVSASDRAGPRSADRAQVVGAAGLDPSEASPRALQAGPATPRADLAPTPQPQATAPPPRNRSLCSAANEAAGLCNPQ